MERIMGCSNDVMLVFAETVQLEHDKQCETATATCTAAAAAACGGNANGDMDVVLQYMLREREMLIEAYTPEVAGPARLPTWDASSSSRTRRMRRQLSGRRG